MHPVEGASVCIVHNLSCLLTSVVKARAVLRSIGRKQFLVLHLPDEVERITGVIWGEGQQLSTKSLSLITKTYQAGRQLQVHRRYP
jgi:hypothetical protein